MRRCRPSRPVRVFAALALASAALLSSVGSAEAVEYDFDTCVAQVGSRVAPNGNEIPARDAARGDSGVCVKAIQVVLVRYVVAQSEKAGFVDGRFGDRTDHYVRVFQKQYRLDADGIVGPRTCGVPAATYKLSLAPLPAGLCIAAQRGSTEYPGDGRSRARTVVRHLAPWAVCARWGSICPPTGRRRPCRWWSGRAGWPRSDRPRSSAPTTR
ncbi:peptidoglycan-binding domain-containing protein [Streptomyces antibioticus]|uniref:peptidoglycan-binding domain-containing protein n=1 Tax=Streptomyces antibioticus TaxID=1890 RepID=UPI0033EB2FBA